jgi:two-component system sensor histidine kinase BaeS
MRLTLQRKFFLALAVLLLALLLMFVGFSRYALQRGIGPYVAEIELSRLDWFVDNLERAYAAEGGWDFLRRDPDAWHRLQRFDRGDEGPHFGPPPGGPPFGDGRELPPLHAAQPDVLPRRFLPPLPPDARHDPRDDADSVYNRVSLLAADGKQLLAGRRPSDDMLRKEINVHGRTVGYLALAPLEGLGSRADRAFVARQSTSVLLTGAGGLVLAFALSALVARRWLRPVSRMAQAAEDIAQGRLDVAVPVAGDDELAQLARTFNGMAAALASVEQSRQRWLADVAHELRTPVTAMRAEIEALQDGVRRFDGGTAQRLHGQVMRLGKLVEDLQLVMNPAQEMLHLEPVDPLAVLAEAAQAMQPRLVQAQLALEGLPQLHALGADPPYVRGDATRLAQVFMNLLENSARYTHAGGRVLLQARVDAQQVHIAIDDTAPGPLPQDLPRLFERFFRAEGSRSRATGGSGLGLAICRGIVEAHGGRIAAHASPLGGLRVEIELPRVGA